MLILLLIPTVYAATNTATTPTNKIQGQDNTNSLLRMLLNSLNNILNKLTIIAAKNTTTVLNVNPNIKLPTKECEWENYNIEIGGFRYSVDYSLGYYNVRYFTAPYSFMLPKELKYSDVNILNAFIDVEDNTTSSPTMAIIINGRDCVVEIGPGSQACPEYFKEGVNTIINPGVGLIRKLFLELELKAANC